MALDLAAYPPRAPARFDPAGRDVLAFALTEAEAGQAAALVTVIGIDGSSSRGLGAQMAVSADGRWLGHISSGCLERDVVAQAQGALAARANRRLRYGRGSPFLDIALPCGSGLDVLVTVAPEPRALSLTVDELAARRPCVLRLDPEARVGGASFEAEGDAAGRGFARSLRPSLRIIAAGRGAELATFAAVARAAGYDVLALSPEIGALAACADAGAETARLESPEAPPPLGCDPWTAFLLLFHDRDWDAALLAPALAGPAGYVGAVGSRRTQALRIAELAAAGVPPEHLARLRGPVGLVPATRDPAALAVSALAEIVSVAPP